MKIYFKKNWFSLCLVAIFFLSMYLRFVNYQQRWGLAYDQAHDALVAMYALDSGSIPLLGPFSSAGPYQTGGVWYWLIIFGTIIFPFTVMSPWIFMTSLYVFFSLAIVWLSAYLVNRQFAIVVGLLAVVSPAQITQGTNLTNQSPQALLALLSIWMTLLLLRTKQKKYALLLGISIGTAASIHLQGAALGVLGLVAMASLGFNSLRFLPIFFLGLIIPWIPVFIVDFQNHFYNTQNMLQYYLKDQYKISLDVLGRRWLTYAGVFWPNIWGFIIGGNKVFGYIIPILLSIFVVISFFRKNLTREWVVLFVSFVLMVTVLRYTRTPLFESYVVFLHPFVLIFTGWAIYRMLNYSRYLGLILLSCICILSLYKDFVEISKATNNTALVAVERREKLIDNHPGKSFALYDLEYKTKSESFPLALYLEEKGLINNEGTKIGMIATDSAQIKENILIGANESVKIIDLSAYTNQELKKKGWIPVSAEETYKSTEDWWR